jgi:hypothetical protein
MALIAAIVAAAVGVGALIAAFASDHRRRRHRRDKPDNGLVADRANYDRENNAGARSS